MSLAVTTERQTSRLDVAPYLESIKQHSAENRSQRRLSEATIQQFKASGLIRSMLPKRWGGLEVTPQEFFSAQIKIAEYDMSSAWVGGIIAVHAFQLALMDERAQADVYDENPDACVSSSYNPVGGKTEIVEGGIMLSGRWGWSSGSDHCQWVLLGAIVPGEGYRTFLVPRSNYEIEDTWHAMGLQGTASNDIVIEKPVFVAHYRTHKQIDGFNCKNKQKNPMYNLPWAQIFVRVVSAPAIGAARHALKIFKQNASTSSTDPTKLIGDPDVLRRVVEAEHLIDSNETILMRNFDAMMEIVNRGQEIPMIDRVRYRYQASVVIDEMIKAVDCLFDIAGGRSVFNGAEIQNIWHDIHVSRAHVANNPVPFARNFGNMMMGGENPDLFV
ncbi:flavin-dependent monooxygenase [Microbulbifer sp. 2205BS26-8]|uniref:Flavin-dependent monooxygenase n=1 Tax=Microbulbifer spongiae TaxID=2944933 RepID=A0ABY9ECI4_9GAMM|nr:MULTISPECIES: flavin-dependent monooxygenase [unclassified Microbulbifer]MDP5209257.1 flavin-dependent monooxygenase [Microbulbifer sp. 2205BS26-8]WKD49070.1 flavin-dependent monooxygenase [Microbulbifer sp. MI-G]